MAYRVGVVYGVGVMLALCVVPVGATIHGVPCDDCFGSRAVPDIFGDLMACPSCVIDAGNTFVVYEEVSGGPFSEAGSTP